MKEYPNILLIGGSGQNVGKSTFVSDILKKHSLKNDIVSIKTSNHFHPVDSRDIIFEENQKYQVLKESKIDGRKDSSLFLKNGAKASYFIMAEDDYLEKAFNNILQLINKNTLVIVESAALRKFIIPKLFIYLKNEDSVPLGIKKEMLNLASLKITNYFENKDEVLKLINIENNSWVIRENKTD